MATTTSSSDAWARLDRYGTAETMPLRVRRAIIGRQIESERLIGWIQLAVVLIFGTLYTIAPKTAPSDAAIHAVPFVLVAYLLFTLLRLWLAYRAWLRRWFLALSAVVDMALLMLLIWSFHLQYDQPAAFYLKAPTWGYVFIFIALRALRFEPRYVLIAGIAAMVGWAALVAYALLVDTGMPITRDYVHYMTSATILMGAEFDKLLTIALVTAILAVALYRGRELLIESAKETEAAKDLARFFPPEIARQITSAERPTEPGEGQLRRAAVLQVDLKAFTNMMAALTPDEAIGLLTEYQGRVVPIIRKHGGSVDKFMGDGIMATFGAASPSTTYAADALRTVQELIDMAAKWGPSHAEAPSTSAKPAAPRFGRALRAPSQHPPRENLPVEISIGVVSGELVVGAVGDADRLEYTVIGHAVNLAAKLEKHTRIEGVVALTTAKTLLRARQQGFAAQFGPPRASQVAGVAEPVELVVLAS